MTLGQRVTGQLGFLCFGGIVIMVCGTAETREYTVELPCGLVVRVGAVVPQAEAVT